MAATTTTETNSLMEVYTGKLPQISGINPSVFNTTRLKAVSPTKVLVAIRKQLFELNIGFPSNPVIEKGRQGPYISRPIALDSVGLDLTNPVLSMDHAIQNINVIKSGQRSIISCIDSHGIISVQSEVKSSVSNSETSIGEEPPSKKRKLNSGNATVNSSENAIKMVMQHDGGSLSDLVFPTQSSSHEKKQGLCASSYCAIDRNQTNTDQFACISSHYKLLNIGCSDQMVSSLYLSQKPRTVRFYDIPKSGNDSSVIMVTEGNILSIWDPRNTQKAVQRIDLKHTMYALDINRKHSSRYIGCCGKDKILYVVDPMKWNVHSMWKSGAKYQLIDCRFSQFDGGEHVYCVGMDHDLICGQWETAKFGQNKGATVKSSVNQKRFTQCFRADSKWIGVDYIANERGFDSMVAVTDTAKLYIAQRPHRLIPERSR